MWEHNNPMTMHAAIELATCAISQIVELYNIHFRLSLAMGDLRDGGIRLCKLQTVQIPRLCTEHARANNLHSRHSIVTRPEETTSCTGPKYAESAGLKYT